MILTLLLAASAYRPAAAQRIDVLTGQPERSRPANGRPDPEIFNAPHAPRQTANQASDTPPVEIYITPQLGNGAANPGGSLPRPMPRRY